MRTKRLAQNFFARDTHLVARELLGKKLIRRYRGRLLSGRITEVESYVGFDDAASHAARGRTPRTEIMFGPAGFAYIYLIYGMYYCLNITTERADVPAAVLIRSLEPLDGMAYMMKARATDTVVNLTTGPGKLTQALHIDARLGHENMSHSDRLFVVNDGYRVRPQDITSTPRIGVAYAGESANNLWRYYLTTSPFVSGKNLRSRELGYRTYVS